MKLVAALILIVACASVATAYSVSGNKILGPTGSAILIRGVARPSLEWTPTGENLGTSDYQLMKNWGANTVRLSLNQCYWLLNHNNYQTTVTNQVTAIKGLGLGVILDLHWSDKGTGGTINNVNGCGQQTMPDGNSAVFWTQVAGKWKNDAWVIFEIYNEPHDVAWGVWKNGGDAGGYQTPGFQSLYNTIRATGANNAVIINGLNYAFDLSGVSANLISGSHIIYGSHPYDFSGKQLEQYQAAFGYLAPNYPIILTEFGNFDCGTAYIQKLLDYCDTNSISWTAWAWYVNGCGFPSLITDWSGTASAPGALVKQRLTSGPKVPGGSGSATTAKSTTTTAKSTTSTTAKSTTTTAKSTTTTAKSTTSTTGKSTTTTGSSGTKITVNVNSGTNTYWISIDSFSGATQTTTKVEYKDSASGAAWVVATKESWGGFTWATTGGKVIVAPVSVRLTADNGRTATLTNVITNIAGGSYLSTSQYN